MQLFHPGLLKHWVNRNMRGQSCHSEYSPSNTQVLLIYYYINPGGMRHMITFDDEKREESKKKKLPCFVSLFLSPTANVY